MSRSYTVLAATLIGVVGLAGVASIVQRGDPIVETASPVEVIDAEALPDIVVADEPADQPVVELADDVRGAMGLDPIAVIDPNCTLSVRLEVGDENDEVACLESQLIAAGALSESAPDAVFDGRTDTAVRRFQAQNGLVVDGVVGPQTATELGVWTGPAVLPPDQETCPATGRSAVVDRYNQRTWLCEEGVITDIMPITTALSQPDPGTYKVYAKDLNASSTISGDYSVMTHFVAFTYGKYQGARIAFHSIPTYPSGEFVQPPESVGTAELHGASAGCIRVLPEDAELIWSWLDIGDTVKVVT